ETKNKIKQQIKKMMKQSSAKKNNNQVKSQHHPGQFSEKKAQFYQKNTLPSTTPLKVPNPDSVITCQQKIQQNPFNPQNNILNNKNSISYLNSSNNFPNNNVIQKSSTSQSPSKKNNENQELINKLKQMIKDKDYIIQRLREQQSMPQSLNNSPLKQQNHMFNLENVDQNQLIGEIERLNCELAKSKNQIKNLQSQIQKFNQFIEKLQNENQQLKDKIDGKLSQNIKSKETQTPQNLLPNIEVEKPIRQVSLTNPNLDLMNQLKSKNEEIYNWKCKNQDLLNDLNEAKNDLKEYKGELQETKNELNDLKNQLKDTRSRLQNEQQQNSIYIKKDEETVKIHSFNEKQLLLKIVILTSEIEHILQKNRGLQQHNENLVKEIQYLNNFMNQNDLNSLALSLQEKNKEILQKLILSYLEIERVNDENEYLKKLQKNIEKNKKCLEEKKVESSDDPIILKQYIDELN
ncbi:hypothetical protein IMG5_116850, partial [Ichthyophthirius multifiliis]